MKKTLRIALLTTDARGSMGFSVDDLPNFGTAVRSLLQGFEMQDGGGSLTEWEGLYEEGVRVSTEAETSNLKSTVCDFSQPRNKNRESHSHFEIHVISCTQQVMCSPEKLSDNIWFHSLHVPKAGWLRSAYLGCALAVRKKLGEIHPDIVHAQGTERDCAVSAVLSPYPRVLTIHGNLRLIKKQVGFRPVSAMWLQSYLEGLVVPRFNGVFCITNYTRKAVEHEVPKIWVVPNAVDTAFLSIGVQRLSDVSARHSTLYPGPEDHIILVVANIDSRKNQNDFIKALDPLAKKMSFQVRFFGKCGDDDYGREFQQLVASRSWCHYGGMISREALQSEFRKASMLVLPTHEDNCPMVVLEAQAAGVPVVASEVGGVPDLIEDGVTGLLVNPQDPATFFRAVKKLLTNDDYIRERLAMASHRKAITHYHPRLIAEKHLDIYEQIIKQKKI
jgi:glycosyltransferase involved in cell wall biosynthesis